MASTTTDNYKFDQGKLDYTTIPTELLTAVAKVREYGIQKYHERDSWKKVEIERYRAALYRHWLAYLDNPGGYDEESGLPHIYHVACNVAFLCALQPLNLKIQKFAPLQPSVHAVLEEMEREDCQWK